MSKKEIKIGMQSDAQANSQVENNVEGATDNVSQETSEDEGEKQTEDEKQSENEKPADDNTSSKVKKMTDEEVEALAESLKDKIGVRVKAVPFNTVTWVDGTIVGVIADKRAHKALYAIKLDDGRRIVKSYDSDLIQFSAEKIEVVKGTRSTSSTKKATSEELEKLEDEAAKLVGTTIKYLPFKGDGKTKIEGVITSIVPDTRSGRILYKIESEIDGLKKISHKVSTSEDIEMTETFDEKMNAEFNARRATRASKANLTTEEKIKAAEEKIKKITEQRKKLDELEATTNAELEALKAQFEKEVIEGIEGKTETETADENDPMA